MKKRLLIALPLAAILLSGCYSEIENELSLIERRIEALEQVVSKMQTNVNSLQSIVKALDSHDFVKSVTTKRNLDGSIEGYIINFSNSAPITIYNGTDAETPVIGVKKADDGIYYWTITYPSTGVTEFVENNFGIKVPATTSTPQIKIENGKWMVNYDGAWENLGQATGSDGTSWVESVTDSIDYIHFVLKDSTVLNFPTWSTYEKILQDIEVARANYNSLDSLNAILESKVYAKDVIPVVSSGDTLGFKLCFSDGRDITIYNGVATNRPVIAAHRDTTAAGDSSLYWCIKYAGQEDYQWLKYSGWMVRADAGSSSMPELGLKKADDNLYYWAVKYPGETDFHYLFDQTQGFPKKVPASASVNARVIDSVVLSDTYVTINAGGKTYYVPRFNDFAVSFSPISGSTMTMGENREVTFTCNIASGNSNYTVLPVTSDGFYAEASTSDFREWTIKVKSPSSFTKSSLTLLISDGRGTTKTYVITINKN